MVKGFQTTEIGNYPLDWLIEPLGRYVKITSGESPSKFSFCEEGVPYFKVEQLNNDGKYASQTKYRISTSTTIPKGSIIFPKRGASIFLNKIRILSEASYMDTNLMTLTILKNEELDNEFLFYQLSHIGLSKIADTTSIPQINNKHINPFILPFPPFKSEQIAISSALNNADELIIKLEQLLTKKRNIKSGAMQELLKPKIDWNWTTVEKLGKPYGGLSGKSKLDFKDGNYPYITFMNVMSNPIIDTTYFDYVKILPTENQHKAQKGDLFFNGSSETPEEVGMCSVLLEDIPNLYLNSFCFGFRLFKEKKTEGLYLAYFFRSSYGRKIFFILAQGATRHNLSKSNFMKIEFRIPKPEEQTRIATILKDIDNEISELEKKIGKYKMLKQGMMQTLLTGKIRLV